MRKKQLPIKYRRHGLYIWCNKCKKKVNKGCAHAERQVYQSRIYNPATRQADCIKTWHTENVDEAFQLHLGYKRELQRNHFVVVAPAPTPVAPRFLKAAAAIYFNYLEDNGVPEFTQRHNTKKHIDGQQRFIVRFLDIVQGEVGKLSVFPITYVDVKLVGLFDAWLRGQGFSDATYNSHMGACRYFFDYLINKHGVEMRNPFQEVKKRLIAYSPEIITEVELEAFFDVITPKNGIGVKGKNKNRVQHYQPWLVPVFKFSLLIGERLDGIVRLRWGDVHDNYIGIPNWKVNRLKNTTVYGCYAPITKDLASLLIEFGVENDSDDYIILPERVNRDTLKAQLTKSFTHFWRLTASKKNVTFKHLRKTYLTRMASLGVTTLKHTNDETLRKHYLAEKELASKFRNVQLFDLKAR